MLRTRFTELIGCAVPLQQAGMGAVAPPELAAAVSEAGGLGMLGTAHPGLSVAVLAEMLDRVQARTARPFGVNFIVPFLHGIGPDGIKLSAGRGRGVEFVY